VSSKTRWAALLATLPVVPSAGLCSVIASVASSPKV